MSYLSPSALRRTIKEIEAIEGLSTSKKNGLIELCEAELSRREEENTLHSLHTWLKRGDQILTSVEKELEELRAITSSDGEFVSLQSVLTALDGLYEDHVVNDYGKGQNWAVETAKERISALPRVSAEK